MLGELCGRLLYQRGFILVASLALLILYLCKISRREKSFFFLLLMISSILVGQISWCLEKTKLETVQEFAEEINGLECSISGKIVERKQQSEEYVSYIIKNPEINSGNYHLKLAGFCKISAASSDKLYPGDEVECLADLSYPETESNPGGYNERRYDLAHRIYLTGYLTKWKSRRRPSLSIGRSACQLKDIILASYREHLLEEDAAMLSAMVLGDKSDLTREQKKLYEENGVMHLLSVSGLHISITGGSLYRLLRKRGKGYLVSCSGGFLLLLFYGFMTGWGSSVLRSFIMYLIYLIAEYSGSSYDLVSSMSLAAVFMLLEAPCRLEDGGFLISYASVLAIGAIWPMIKTIDRRWREEDIRKDGKGLDKLYYSVRESLASSIVICLVTMPVVMRYYYECTPYSILLNPLILPFMTPLMLSALLAGILGWISSAQTGLLSILSDSNLMLWGWRMVCLPAILILRAYHILFQYVRSWPGALLITGCPSLPMIALIYLCEMLFLLLLYKKCWRRGLLLLGILFLLGHTPCLSGTDGDSCRITMLDVGQGDAILLRLPGRKTMLIDGGSSSQDQIYEYVIRPALYYYGIRHLDYVVITHMDEDHISGIRELLTAGYPVSYLITGTTYYRKDTDQEQGDSSQQEIYDLAIEDGARYLEMEAGDELQVRDVLLQCLHPQKEESYADRNDKSLVLYLQYQNFSALFPGDLSSEQEEHLITAIRKPVTLLKVAHHGSRYSTDSPLLEVIKPEYAIISAGQNNLYGHPHQELLDRLYEINSKVYQTKLGGAICVESLGEDCKVTYWKEKQ